ncbi:MAG: hypothetical protein EDM03_08910 [Porphyrobacter sp. IPPAS B-1204]|nr:MAG: hypothetical protein EDM03_08910 [Porphyrobacter sp. IPPAS B-1204]
MVHETGRALPTGNIGAQKNIPPGFTEQIRVEYPQSFLTLREDTLCLSGQRIIRLLVYLTVSEHKTPIT